MNITSYDSQIQELQNQITLLKSEVDILKNRSENDLWDNSDMIRNWNVSKRTLVAWRANGKIEYIKVGDKIWYTKKQRDAFRKRNTIKVQAIACRKGP